MPRVLTLTDRAFLEACRAGQALPRPHAGHWRLWEFFALGLLVQVQQRGGQIVYQLTQAGKAALERGTY